MPKDAASPPVALEPTLCTLAAEPIDVKGWLYEPMLDGLRVLVSIEAGEVALRSRDQKLQNFQFPDVVGALRASVPRDAVLDGEIVCLDEHGLSSFRALQQR